MAFDAAHGEMSFGFIGGTAGVNSATFRAASAKRAQSHCARDLAEGEVGGGVKEVGGPAGGTGAVGPGGAATFGCS